MLTEKVERRHLIVYTAISDRQLPGDMEIFMGKSSNEIREVSSIHMITVSF